MISIKLIWTVVTVLAWVPPGEYHTPNFTFFYAPLAKEDARAMVLRAESVRTLIVGDLGRAPPSPTTVVVVATRDQWKRAQPRGHRFPAWVAGVAYPRLNLIILGPAAPGGRRVAREVLFAHEYSHIALAHATGFRKLPIWFVEGFADLQAMAPYAGDWRSWGGHGALPLGALHRSLGGDGRRASESYRQSYDFVRYLRGRGDAESFRRLIGLVAGGMAFDRALKQVYRLSTTELESRWRRDWNWRNVIVPMITSGLFLWVIAAVLLLLGYVRKRRERRKAMAAMEGWEDDEDDGESQALFQAGWSDGGPDPGPEEGEDDEEGAGDSPVFYIGFGTLLAGTLVAIVFTGFLTLLWPTTRVWILAGPAVMITFLALRWTTRHDAPF